MAAVEHELHTLAGAYAMDAVSGAERRDFEQHLAQCQACNEEIAGFRAATAKLAAAAAIRPRPELRDKVTAAAFLLPQHRPVVAADRVRRRSSLWPPVAAIAAAAACAVVVALGIADRGMSQQLDTARHGSRMIADVLAAPDAVMLTATVSDGGTATIVMSRREHAAVFTARGLPALPAARRYELWLLGPRGARAAGMVPMTGGSMAGPAVLSGLRSGEVVGLTVEPATGSGRPTSAPLVLLGSPGSQQRR